MLDSRHDSHHFSWNHEHCHSALTTDIRSFLEHDSALNTSLKLSKSSCPTEVQVTPPQACVGGKSQAEWADDWWKWAYSISDAQPNSVHPFFDNNGVGTINGKPIVQNGLVYNLVGSYNNVPIEGGYLSQVNRGDFENNQILIRDNQYIFAPMLNTQADNGAPGTTGTWMSYGLPAGTHFTETELRRLNNSVMQTVTNLFLEVDGVSLIADVKDWQKYRQTSSTEGFSFTPSELSFLDPTNYPPGVAVPGAVSDGYWFMLNPLSTGNHTVHFGGVLDLSKIDVDLDGNPTNKTEEEKILDQVYRASQSFKLDITYNITSVSSKLDISVLAG